jgi:hypothetical protein
MMARVEVTAWLLNDFDVTRWIPGRIQRNWFVRSEVRNALFKTGAACHSAPKTMIAERRLVPHGTRRSPTANGTFAHIGLSRRATDDSSIGSFCATLPKSLTIVPC